MTESSESSLTYKSTGVQRSLLGSQIAESLRRDILLGVVRPGTRLSQQQLCEQFGTSRMPVRDALRVLTYEGLVANDSAQHSIVAPLSRDDLNDAYLIEGTLTGMATERASRNATSTDLDALLRLHNDMLASASAHDSARTADLNWRLHRSINRLSRSRKLLQAIKTVSLDLPRDFLAEAPAWIDLSNRYHDQIITAMSDGRHREAGTLMTEHIVESGRGLIELLESRGLELD